MNTLGLSRYGLACAFAAGIVSFFSASSSRAAADVLPAAGLVSKRPMTSWSFTLPRKATTSAGVYDSEGRLLRTLWRAEELPVGQHQQAWDGRDDQGQVVAARDIEIRVVHHRLAYVWEGVIGNSSRSFGGPRLHRAYLPPTSILIHGDRAIYAVGYNEGMPGLHGFALSTPQNDTRPLPSTDPFVSFTMIAADANRLFWANGGGMSHSSFIGVFDLDTARTASFSAGTPVCLNYRANSKTCYADQSYASVIDLHTEAVDAPTGLAVQRNGRVLAVAHGGRNLIRLYDNNSGTLLREISVPLNAKALNQLAMSSSGDLWVVSRRSVLRYTDIDSSPRVAATINGLTRPLALAATPGDDDGLWVADGGASQQLKRYDAQGQQVATLGAIGGYTDDPSVSAGKLCFQARSGEQTALAAAPDGSIWVVDTCNNRMLRLLTDSANTGRSDAQIAYLPAVYTSTVDHGSPRRVFANFLEFEVDNTAPLQPGRSWKLVRNWRAGLPAALQDDRASNWAWGGFLTVETLSNGRTYGIVQAQGRQVIVELPAAGPLRVVKSLAQPFPGATAKVMYENGDLGFALTGPSSQAVMRQPLADFNSQGDPVWSTDPVKLASVPTLPGSPHVRGAFSGILPPRFPVTSSGRVVYFDQSVVGNEGFHLGAAEMNGTQWLWQASPSGALDGKGSFQTKAIDGSTTYGGNAVWAHGRHIVYGYHGEFYKDMQTGKVGQANQFMHFDESGLFLGQFGQPSTRPSDALQTGLSGNAFSPTLVRDDTRLYLYHNDESSHGGVHRWRIDGWDDIGDLRGNGQIGSTIVLR